MVQALAREIEGTSTCVSGGKGLAGCHALVTSSCVLRGKGSSGHLALTHSREMIALNHEAESTGKDFYGPLDLDQNTIVPNLAEVSAAASLVVAESAAAPDLCSKTAADLGAEKAVANAWTAAPLPPALNFVALESPLMSEQEYHRRSFLEAFGSRSAWPGIPELCSIHLWQNFLWRAWGRTYRNIRAPSIRLLAFLGSPSYPSCCPYEVNLARSD